MFLHSSISLNGKEVVALIGCFQSSVLNTFGEFYYLYLFKSREVEGYVDSVFVILL